MVLLNILNVLFSVDNFEKNILLLVLVILDPSIFYYLYIISNIQVIIFNKLLNSYILLFNNHAIEFIELFIILGLYNERYLNFVINLIIKTYLYIIIYLIYYNIINYIFTDINYNSHAYFFINYTY